ncbi:hypothetical protein SPRG_01514 [Saprolegnia parasitica CBS 223.65]|uniref:Uncharacterized protein n=1 Tax=Saprolegnia parasitica (strain CBS 223.65) TaxID=695850 RepID=A0A067CV39_SAPPC|nr:hypothetical protein SPRG_01514 [Saprolegnia parasitica CBS 223.65]KDO34378.1 hypothetical protein SPRG_01514 [Saprolegnia parasitica CBS 223.65]|eukprot:XP_012195114.1 hypothetical protein SPRG_01514 [Saprolegnia parasitica CBS 223.65]
MYLHPKRRLQSFNGAARRTWESAQGCCVVQWKRDTHADPAGDCDELYSDATLPAIRIIRKLPTCSCILSTGLPPKIIHQASLIRTSSSSSSKSHVAVAKRSRNVVRWD